MADDNKPIRYMRYAIGEIVLVVIGILIALQINTWNENRKDHEDLKSYLHVVLVNLEDDLRNTNFRIDELKEINKKTKSFLNHPDYNLFTLDSLEQSIETFYLDDVSASQSGFNKIERSGIVNYGLYDTIMNGVNAYYQHVIPYLKDQVDDAKVKVKEADKYWRYQQDVYEFNYVDGIVSYQSERKQAIIRLIKSPIPRNILKLEIRTNQNTIDGLNQIKKFLNTLIPEIKDALKVDSIETPAED